MVPVAATSILTATAAVITHGLVGSANTTWLRPQARHGMTMSPAPAAAEVDAPPDGREDGACVCACVCEGGGRCAACCSMYSLCLYTCRLPASDSASAACADVAGQHRQAWLEQAGLLRRAHVAGIVPKAILALEACT